ncbi:cytochrome P450 [Nocardia nova SH22a]|uniref:Cytochrome P450 n=1 Tax=Nocardia nova SH22a TaxID=1415166 RepID=W5TGT8_9NOCA|nr:cytochrome P450 [Nocardia nova]AHH18354.1 cytochrome P450 [Nocardia nova SH22a]
MKTALPQLASDALADAALRVPVREQVLVTPPSGSGLRPVPGDPGPPLVGYSFNVFGDLLALQRRLFDRYGPVHWTSAFGTKLVIAVGPEATDEVLANRDKSFANIGWEPFLGPFFRRGIILLDFDEHRHHRRIMQQAFTRARLLGYLELINRAADRALDEWDTGVGFPMYSKAKQLTLDIATGSFVGAPLGGEADRLHRAFTDTVQGGLSIVRADIPGGRWHAGLRGRRVLEEYFRSQLPARRADPGTSLFGVLCQAEDETGAGFGDDDIVNHMIFLLMAAHDTTTTTVAMMAYHLAANPRWQRRARQESLALGKPAIDYDDLEHLPTLDLVMKETLRLSSPVGTLARETVCDTELLGHFIPAGTTVAVTLASSHRMEPWWNDPETFDPGRFSPERREDKDHRTKFAPFGAGVHKCIGMHFGGMEVKAILHQMLLRFAWTVPAGYRPRMGYLTGPYPADGLPIDLNRSTPRGSRL